MKRRTFVRPEARPVLLIICFDYTLARERRVRK